MFLFVLLIPLLGLTFVGWHLWMLLPLGCVWKTVIIGLGLACFLTLFLDLNGTLDRLPLPLARMLYEVGTTSLLVLFYLALAFLLLDIGRLAHLIPGSWLNANLVTSVALSGILLVVFLCGNIHYYSKVRVLLNATSVKPLDKDYTIVMASDLHLGYHNSRKDLARWVDMMNAERPDLILIAGDIIDISVQPLIKENMAAEFHRLTAPVYACLGNHEYYAKEAMAQRFYDQAGIRLLRDSCAQEGSLCIIGRDDRTNPHRQAIGKLMRQADSSRFCILLDHQPYHLEQAEKAGIDFQLSGHTHEGQIWPISWLTHRLYECAWGEYRRGNTRYYVSSGLGIWGGKYRIGTQSEYVVLKLSASR